MLERGIGKGDAPIARPTFCVRPMRVPIQPDTSPAAANSAILVSIIGIVKALKLRVTKNSCAAVA